MNYYYPWIDPRVKQVRSEHLMAYLRAKTWNEDPSRRLHFISFRHPTKKAAVYVPTLNEADDYLQCILDAVTQLAKIEERYAGDVVTDLLAVSSVESAKKPTHAAPENSDALPHPVNR